MKQELETLPGGHFQGRPSRSLGEAATQRDYLSDGDFTLAIRPLTDEVVPDQVWHRPLSSSFSISETLALLGLAMDISMSPSQSRVIATLVECELMCSAGLYREELEFWVAAA